jgi:endonuclease YncB( thermonuclease family)
MTTWTVPARVTRVVDGDTLVADLDLGWGIWHIGAKVRLAGINCPEMGTPEGHAAREFALDLLPVVLGAPGGWVPVTITSKALDKYGRTLAEVTLPDGRSLRVALLAAGHAEVAR